MKHDLRKLVDYVLAKRIFDDDDLKGYKSKNDIAGICDCSSDDDDGGCSN
jgi:hypothetical protein